MKKFLTILVLTAFCIGTGYGVCKSESAGKAVMKDSFTIGEMYKRDALSKPFTTTEPNQTIEVKLFCNLDNKWLYYGVGLVREKDQKVLVAEDKELSYYHGYEGGESWSEGSRYEYYYWKVKEPGQYRVIMAVESKDRLVGNWMPVKIEVSTGVHRTYLLGIMLGLWITSAIGVIFVPFK